MIDCEQVTLFMKNIYILGSINIDLVITTPYVPNKGETIIGNNFFISPGGKGANQAVAIGKLGGNVFIGGCIGNDEFGQIVLKNMLSNNVNVDSVKHLENCNTGIAFIILSDSDNRIIIDTGANSLVTYAEVNNLLSSAQRDDIFLTQLEIPIDVVGYALKYAKSKGLYTIVNPAPANKEILSYRNYIDLLIPNETELQIISEEEDINHGVDKLTSMGFKKIVVTLGDKGYLYKDLRTKFYSAGNKVKAIDTTGAGDCFCGSLAYKIACGSNIYSSLEFANKAAAISVTRNGAQNSYPNIHEIK